MFRRFKARLSFCPIIHKLFFCPTFWSRQPAFTCPRCGRKYRCYWDGHDIENVGKGLCTPCFTKYAKDPVNFTPKYVSPNDLKFNLENGQCK